MPTFEESKRVSRSDMPKRVLITGAGGFTGRYLAAELQNSGWSVAGISQQAAEGNGHLQFTAGLSDQSKLLEIVKHFKPHAVVHLAAIAFVGHGKVADFYDTNLVGTRNLLQAIDRSGVSVSSIIVASSANIYGNKNDGQLSESASPDPVNEYAVSKLAMEYMAKVWAASLPITITRPFNYTGVGQQPHFLIPKIVKHFKNREASIELGNLDVARDFSDVRDVAYVYRRLLEIESAGEIVNICSGSAYSLKFLLSEMVRQTDHTPEVRVNPSFVRGNEVRTLSGDPTHLHQLIGDFERHSIEQTLSWMLRS